MEPIIHPLPVPSFASRSAGWTWGRSPGGPELKLSVRGSFSQPFLNRQHRGESAGRREFIFGSEFPPMVKGGEVGATILVLSHIHRFPDSLMAQPVVI